MKNSSIKNFIQTLFISLSFLLISSCGSELSPVQTELSKPILSIKTTPNEAQLTWKQVLTVTSYEVYRKTYDNISSAQAGDYSKLTQLSSQTTTYTDTTVISGTKYAYQIHVTIMDASKNANSVLSDEVIVIIPSSSTIVPTSNIPSGEDSAKEFDTLNAAGNNGSAGIWSDGTTMWIADYRDAKVYAYNLSSKARDSNKDFNTLAAAGNNSPYGIWSDGTTMWVTDYADDKVYAYNLTTKARDSNKDFDTLVAAGNDLPFGIWSDGTTMWITDPSDDKVYAYSLNTKVRETTKDFDTLVAAGNSRPYGIWSDGTTMWVADDGGDKLYAYNMASKARDFSKDFNTLDGTGNNDPTGLWSNGTTMWIADDSDDKVYAYSIFSSEISPPNTLTNFRATSVSTTSISLSWNNVSGVVYYELYRHTNDVAADVRPIVSRLLSASISHTDSSLSTDTTYYYWIKACNKGGCSAFSQVTSTKTLRILGAGNTNSEKNFNTLDGAGNNHPEGIWSDGITMWVTDDFDDKIYAYNIVSKAIDSAKDFNTLSSASNNALGEIWSDGTTMWVVDSSDDKLYAYNMASKARDSAKDFNTLDSAGNDSPCGIWSDGTTMWVSDYSDAKIYAYNIVSKARDSAKDFDIYTLGSPSNSDICGIWSDGSTIWVTDRSDHKIYAYNLNTKVKDSSRDFNILSVDNKYPIAIWSDSTTMWVVGSEDAIYAYSAFSSGLLLPVTLRAIAATTQSISLSWSDAFEVSYYEIYRSSSNNKTSSSKIKTQLASVGTVYTDSILGAGTTYYYWVKACKDSGDCSALSAIASAKTVRLSAGSRDSVKDFNSANNPTGIWSDGTTMWIADNSIDKIHAYNVADKVWTGSSKEFNTLDGAGNNNPYGIWSDGTTMWVADDGDDKIYAYNFNTKARDSVKDFNTLSSIGNTAPKGIWSDGITMWVADSSDEMLYAYNLASKVRDSAKDFDTLDSAGNDDPQGIWSDGITMWVADSRDDKLYAYNMASKARDSAKDFNTLSSAGNDFPIGIWSDNTTIWVADYSDEKLYAYSAFSSAIALNDTGITWGGNYRSDKQDDTDCSPTGFESGTKQDCHYGRDAEIVAGTLNKIGGGVAGFAFTKLGNDGNRIALQNQSWSNFGSEAAGTQWSCVKDNHTGLIWEVKTDDGGIHDKDNAYRWGGKTAVGKNNNNKEGTYYSDWDSLVDGSNNNSLCGKDDWRVPSINELRSILHYGGVNYEFAFAIDMHYFPNTQDNFWTAFPNAETNSLAWKYEFDRGGDNKTEDRSDSYGVRLVSGYSIPKSDEVVASFSGQTHKSYIDNFTPNSRYNDHGNGTVTDKYTGLMWAKCSIGQNTTSCSGSASNHNWKQALEVAKNSTLADYSDWRLPNIKELSTLIAYDRNDPSINLSRFPNTPSSTFWTSSPGGSHRGNAATIQFSNGYDSYGSHSNDYFVRLVRSGSYRARTTGGNPND
jgi:fibronectin type 3 domain-containing protein